jgi:hypothetical protein
MDRRHDYRRKDTMTKNPSRARQLLMTAAIVAGAAGGAATIAGAASSSSSSTTPAASSTAPAGAPANGQPPAGAPDPSTMTHGPGETLLTGSDLSSAVAAANTAVPGATVVRAETDSDSSGYEVHLKKADGSFVTVHLSTAFAVTSTEDGFGPGPAGGHGAPPAGATASASSTN